MGTGLRADGFFEGNRKAKEWLAQGKGLDEVPSPSKVHLLQMDLSFCGTESIPYISVGLEGEGWAPILKNHRSYCMDCYQSEKLNSDEVAFFSGSRFQREEPD